VKRFRLSPEAAADVREIWEYIALDSIRSARRVRLVEPRRSELRQPFGFRNIFPAK
jgi:plasmid stabilization system protein ParE